MNDDASETQVEDLEGLDESKDWGDYPLDEVLIRSEHRAVQDVLRRIERESYIMDPEFQRDFIWGEDKQSKLIESVIMRIPLPVFYTAEDKKGRVVVVDGLQRLSTFRNFVNGDLRLRLPERQNLHRRRFSDLDTRHQNRIEECNLLFYVIDAKAPERARLDIFERVNGGVPLTRQQMRNCMYMGRSTKFLKVESNTETFLDATGNSLNRRTMRDREFVNRFCAFQTLGVDAYSGDMDGFLAKCLVRMNDMKPSELEKLSAEFRLSLSNNYGLFERHSFRRPPGEGSRRNPINAALWDAMSTGLSHYPESVVESHAENIKEAVQCLLSDDEFVESISRSTGDTKWVRHRLRVTRTALEEVLGA